jgi:hypothetical protein
MLGEAAGRCVQQSSIVKEAGSEAHPYRPYLPIGL